MIIRKYLGNKTLLICVFILFLVSISIPLPFMLSEAQISTEKIVFVTRGSNPALSTALSLIDDVEILEESQPKQDEIYQNITLPDLYDVGLLIL
ncbi:MAG: hypothetical protein ACFFDI_31375, partial [Promethearchaeota archaeon]